MGIAISTHFFLLIFSCFHLQLYVLGHRSRPKSVLGFSCSWRKDIQSRARIGLFEDALESYFDLRIWAPSTLQTSPFWTTRPLSSALFSSKSHTSAWLPSKTVILPSPCFFNLILFSLNRMDFGLLEVKLGFLKSVAPTVQFDLYRDF